MAVIGNPRTHHKGFLFVVQIDGVDSGDFQTCSELSGEIGKVEQREGGRLLPDKEPGFVNMTDVTLERGATESADLFEWWEEVFAASAGIGQVSPGYKRNLDIVQRDRDGSTLRRWALTNAWPTKFVAGAWDNNAEENVIESLVLTFDFFELIQ